MCNVIFEATFENPAADEEVKYTIKLQPYQVRADVESEYWRVALEFACIYGEVRSLELLRLECISL